MQIKTGAIINISWPDTKVAKTNAPYDAICTLIGFCKDGYYQVGHAALLLVHYETGEVRYFDFGRYHTPEGYGRVRDCESDPEMFILTKANILNKRIINLEEILHELDNNISTHGDGKLVCSITHDIDYERSFGIAKLIQSKGAVKYGPLDLFGTNCSRFVATIYKAGISNYWKRNRINLSYVISQTPTTNILLTKRKNNVYILQDGQVRSEKSAIEIFRNPNKLDKSIDENTMDFSKIPCSAYQLKGKGCSTFFTIDKTDKSHLFRIRRYSEQGNLEIDALYMMQTLGFDFTKSFEFAYISSGISINLKQGKEYFELKNINYLRSSITYEKYQNRRLRLSNYK